LIIIGWGTSFGIWFIILYAKKVFGVQIVALDTLMFYWGLHPVLEFFCGVSASQGRRPGEVENWLFVAHAGRSLRLDAAAPSSAWMRAFLP
jgi:hypothetical protein